jgi:hypothetical protein
VEEEYDVTDDVAEENMLALSANGVVRKQRGSLTTCPGRLEPLVMAGKNNTE